MIKVENDYESVIYEQPFPSHIYENQSEFLQNHYTTPINSTPTTQETNAKKYYRTTQSKCQNKMLEYKPQSTKNIQKEQPKEKILDNTISLRKPKK